MHFENARWQSGYTVVDVRDPAEMDERSQVSSRLPGRNAAHCYSLRDSSLNRMAKGTLLTRLAMRRAGDLQLSQATDRFGTAIGIVEPGMPAYCFGLIHSGGMAVTCPDARPAGTDGWTEISPGQGFIHGGKAGTHLLTQDQTARTNLWIATSRLESALEACLQERLSAPLVFAPSIDWTAGPGAGLRRLLAHAEAEFVEPNGLATNPVALAAFTDLFVHTALRTLPHSHREQLARPDHPAPAHLRRAEIYLEAHAETPLRLDDVAAEAGCSVRALQRAFRRFRATTPHAAIQAARLERARADFARGAGSVATVAHRFGFTNTGRFAAAYAKRFGAPPVGSPFLRR